MHVALDEIFIVRPRCTSILLYPHEDSAVISHLWDSGCTCQNRIFETDWRVWAVLGVSSSGVAG